MQETNIGEYRKIIKRRIILIMYIGIMNNLWIVKSVSFQIKVLKMKNSLKFDIFSFWEIFSKGENKFNNLQYLPNSLTNQIMLLKILNKYQRISNKKYQKGDQNYEDQARMYRKKVKKVNKINDKVKMLAQMATIDQNVLYVLSKTSSSQAHTSKKST